MFVKYESLANEEYVTVADNNKLKVLGKGNIALKVHVDGKILDITVENVFFVPEICVNLLSVGQIVERQNSV